MHPQDIGRVLWDIPEEKRAALPPDFLIRRAVSYGTVFLMLAMKRTYGAETLRNAISAMKPRSMSARRRAFVEKVLLA